MQKHFHCVSVQAQMVPARQTQQQQQQPQRQQGAAAGQAGQQAGHKPSREQYVRALRQLMMQLDTAPENYDEAFSRVRLQPMQQDFPKRSIAKEIGGHNHAMTD